MPVIKKVRIVASVSIDQCYSILQEVGASVDKCLLIEANSKDFLQWRKDNGMWKPVFVRANLIFIQPSKTEVNLSAEMRWLLIDTAGKTTQTIDAFESFFKQRVSAFLQRQPRYSSLPPLLKDVKCDSVADEIRKLAELKEEGIISEDEFISQKKKLF